jgi:Tfp pilus assembly protein PilO
MKRLSKEKRDRLLIVAVATVITLVALWFTLIEGQKSALATLAKKHVEAKDKLAAAQHVLESRGEIAHRLDSAGGKLREIEADMVSGDMYDWIIRTVKNFKAPYKERIEIPNFSREVLGDLQMFPRFPYKTAVFNIRGTAYYHDFGRFITDLENRFPFLRVQNLDLEPASSSSATATDDAEKLSFRFEVVALVAPTAVIPAPTGATAGLSAPQQ